MNIQLLQLLPEDLLNVIYEYLTTSTLAWLNKTNYIEHHIKIRKLIDIFGIIFNNCCSVARGVFAFAKPMRFDTRKI